MRQEHYDIAVIGSGPGGEKAAIEAAKLGAKTAIVERGVKPGGASVISGTLPSKSLRETAQYVESLHKKEISGFDIGLDHRISIEELMHRRHVVMSKRVDGIFNNYKKMNIDYIRGQAHFTSDKSLHVQSLDGGINMELVAEKTIIAVGTRPYHPPDIQFDGKHILDSDTVLNLKSIPKEMAIYGGGVIGSEYASIFSKLGVRVYLIDPRGTLLDFIDHELSLCLAYQLQSEGVILRMGEQYDKIEVVDGKVKIALNSGRNICVPVMLYANGRQGNADTLNLEACGLSMNKRNQLDVNSFYQTEVPHIYAVGDVIGFPSLVSVSNEEGRKAAQHAVNGESVNRVGGLFPYGIYTCPEIAYIGPTEKELMDEKVNFEAGVCQFKDLARGVIIGDHSGILKLLFHAETKKLLAVHILGTHASELIHIGQAVIDFGGSIDYFIDSVYNFPTLSSAYKVAARDGLSRLE